MAQKNNNKSKRGFTIIEVVLVLAIAGLIFLMVFIALPALQRSQRDTQRRNDYSMLSTAVTSYITNNGGRVNKLAGTGVNTTLDEKKWINAEGTDPNGFPYHLYACSYSGWDKEASTGEGGEGDAATCGSGKATVNPGDKSEGKAGTGRIPTTGDDGGSEVFIITNANCSGTDSNGNAAPATDNSIRAYVIYGYLEGSGTYCQDNNKTVKADA